MLTAFSAILRVPKSPQDRLLDAGFQIPADQMFQGLQNRLKVSCADVAMQVLSEGRPRCQPTFGNVVNIDSGLLPIRRLPRIAHCMLHLQLQNP